MTFPTSQNLYGIGVGSATENKVIQATRDPTSLDVNYPILQQWFNQTTKSIWTLSSLASSSGTVTATWIISSTLGALSTLTGNSGGPISPVSGNINTVGDGSVITTAGSGNTLNTAITGTVPVNHGGTGATTLTGVLSGNGTSPITASTVTQHQLLLGGASNSISQVAGTGVSGQVLASGGPSADPVWANTPFTSYFVGTITADGDHYITDGSLIQSAGIVFIGINAANYIHEMTISYANNKFDFTNPTLTILTNYFYPVNPPPITHVFFSLDAATNIYVTITIQNTPIGGSTIYLSGCGSPLGFPRVGLFTPTITGTLEGFGPKILTNGGYGFTNVPVDSHTLQNNIFIANGNVPSGTPTGGGILYVDAGALKYIGTAGTTTTIAPA